MVRNRARSPYLILIGRVGQLGAGLFKGLTTLERVDDVERVEVCEGTLFAILYQPLRSALSIPTRCPMWASCL